MFILQVLIVLIIVAAAVTMLLFKARSDRLQDARDRSLAAAEAFAHGPGLVETLRGPDPSSVLQPLAEADRKRGGVDFIVVMNRDGIRYTHPEAQLIGQKFVGTIGPARQGRVTVETVNGPLGELVQAIVPVTDSKGSVVGMLASGVKIDHVSSEVDRQLPVVLGAGAAALALAMAGTALVSRRLRQQTHGLGPAEMTRMYEHHDAVLHAVREGVVIMDGQSRLVLANDEARRLLSLAPDAEGRRADELGLAPGIAAMLASRRVASDEIMPVGDRLLAVNNRSISQRGGPPGCVATLRDSTAFRELAGRAEVTRRRLDLLYSASTAIGTTLDVRRTAEELAQAPVPGFSDFVTVDLAEAVLRGEEPQSAQDNGTTELHRVALCGIGDDHPLYRVGAVHRYAAASPMATTIASGQPTLVSDIRVQHDWHRLVAEHFQPVLDHDFRSLITVPLKARGVFLGIVNLWRTGRCEPFEEDDLSLAKELAARASVCIDNGRHITREHTMAVALQHSLLPHGLPEQNALDIAYRYLPAQAGVGGDWFDVIPLPGTRIALVVGHVVGHGLHAAATMGRLRTAVQNFSTLDLPPGELLEQVDELASRIDQEAGSDDVRVPISGATCLYAIYDPTSGMCSFARAGHSSPAIVRPDGSVEFPELPAGSPLGRGGPFESGELHLLEGSSLVLYTNGLIESRRPETDTGLQILTATLSHPGRTPEEICDAALASLPPDEQCDDIVLLVARTRVLPSDRVVSWEIPSDPAAVAGVRADATRQLAEWGLGEVAFATELILSELATNAIRYGSGPIQVRLLYDRSLICEVSDTSNTSPHLRYAAEEDEGGRGLFLIAQLADAWGTRYQRKGKIIWTEQLIAETAEGGSE
ncbi:SpoIIE family protein phosphatase [Streptomyces klenkii]|uniref:SpoIIE family protein phosphatase n=1 Tax=Streptomyces klenkii TaxID=1420899 RepID=UPI00342C7B16